MPQGGTGPPIPGVDLKPGGRSGLSPDWFAMQNGLPAAPVATSPGNMSSLSASKEGMTATTENRIAAPASSPGPLLESEHFNGKSIDEVLAEPWCRNCNSAVTGTFCSACGQARISERLSFRKLIGEIPGRFLNLERGLLHTAVSLFRRPGAMARDYVYGQRKKYVNPLGYFVFGATLQLISFWFSGPLLRETMARSVDEAIARGAIRPDDLEKLNSVFKPDFVTGITDTYMVAIAQSYTYAALLFFALPFAVFLRLLQGAAGSRYRLAEHMVFSSYVVAQVLIITAFTTPVVFRFGSTAQAASGPLIYLAYAGYAQSGFYPKSLTHISLTLVALLASMVIFFASIIGIFFVSLVVHALQNGR